MRFLGRVREEAAALGAPYTMANYGYGMVFYTSFRGFVEECLNLNELTSAKRVVVLGSNLGTEALFFLHLFGGDKEKAGVYVTGVEILCDLVEFSRENVATDLFNKSYPHDRIEFVCGDALDADVTMLENADMIWIDNQVWDLPPQLVWPRCYIAPL